MTTEKIDCKETEDSFEFTIQIQIYPKKGVSFEEMEAFVAEKKKGVEDAWNDQDFPFEWEKGDPHKKVRIKVEVTLLKRLEDRKKDGGSIFGLNPGRSKQRFLANLTNLFLFNSISDWAHELGHLWGLNEEYSEDGQATNYNVMGNSQSAKVEKYHLVTLLYIYHPSLSREEREKRKSMISYIKVLGWKGTRHQCSLNPDLPFKEEDIKKFADFLKRNKTKMQPKPPPNPN